MGEPEAGPKATRTDHNIGLFLALYLLVLAFFIVLQTISQREEVRTVAAIDSLTATFRAERPSAIEAPQFTSSSAPLDPLESFRREVASVFERELPLVKADVLQLGNAMRVRVPGEALFLPGGATLRSERTRLMEALADALSRRPGERRFEVEFVVGSGSAFAAGAERPGLATRRAAALARDLRGRGVAQSAIAAGVRRGDPGTVELLFSERRGDAARLSFEDLVR